MKDTKRIVLLGILTSLAIALSLIDKSITPLAFPFMPTAKIGIANIIVVIALYKFNFNEVLTLVLIKTVIANFLFGGITSFIIGGSASITSFFAMYGLFLIVKKYTSAIGISVVGGFVHIMIQLLVSRYYYGIGDVVMFYGVMLVFISLISSIIIGFIANRMILYLEDKWFINKPLRLFLLSL